MKFIVINFILLMFVVGCGDSNSQDTTKKINQERGKMDTVNNDSVTVAVVTTNMGEFEIELFSKEAPKTVENFKGLSEKGYYKGVIFHRVIDGFVIQGGDPTGTGRGGQSIWGRPFQDEFDKTLKHDSAGILSMANAGPNSNGSQFFVTLAPTPWLDGRHSIFGKVISGLDVVMAIGKVPVDDGDRPLENVVMEDVKIEKRAK